MKTTRFQLIEIQITANKAAGSKEFIKDQPQLRTQTDQEVIIEAIETFDIVAIAVAPSGTAVAAQAAISNVLVVLNVQGYETNQFIPLSSFNRLSSSDTAVQRVWQKDLYEFNGLWGVDWTKSYLQFGATQNAGVSFLLGVHYRVNPNDNRPFPGQYNARQS